MPPPSSANHLYSETSCNEGRTCFNNEARRDLLPGEEERLFVAASSYGAALAAAAAAGRNP